MHLPMQVIFSHLFMQSITRWLHGTVVERQSLTSELSLSHARPLADG